MNNERKMLDYVVWMSQNYEDFLTILKAYYEEAAVET